jgi:hypothetical protein
MLYASECGCIQCRCLNGRLCSAAGSLLQTIKGLNMHYDKKTPRKAFDYC